MATKKTNGTTTTNAAPVQPVVNEAELAAAERMRQDYMEMIANASASRTELLARYLDPRRDINKECGYPETQQITPATYRMMYDREPIATRVVQVLPQETWKIQPNVYEDEDPEVKTPFEEAWDDLSKNLRGTSFYQDEAGSPVWEHLQRADELSGIGHFGILLMGFSDGKALQDPVEGVPADGQAKDVTGVSQSPAATQSLEAQGTDAQYGYGASQYRPASVKQGEMRLLFLRAFDESLVEIVQYEADVTNPRFGQPVMYNVTLNDPREQHSGVGLPLATVRVHWSRVIHIADNLGSSEIFGVPRMRPVWNRLCDLVKLYSGSAEMYWRGAFPGISMETHPSLGGDVRYDKTEMRQQMENYHNGLQRFLAMTGMTAKTLAPQVVDPTPQISTQVEAICIQKAIPMRIFSGSERGELASSQDAGTWNGRLRYRQITYVTPRMIVPFVDRLILVGILPEPEGYSVVWPDFATLTKAEEAAIAVQRTQALAAYIQGNVEALVAPKDYLTRVLAMTDEEAASVLDSTLKHMEEVNPDSDEPIVPGHVPTPPAPAGTPVPAGTVAPGAAPNVMEQEAGAGTGQAEGE